MVSIPSVKGRTGGSAGRRGRPGRRLQPQGTRARAAVAHPVAQSRTPTCDTVDSYMAVCRRGDAAARAEVAPPRTSAARQPSGPC
jgi:hypothetical protein